MLNPCCKRDNHLLSRKGSNLLACPVCGIVWQKVQPSDAELSRIYNESYYDAWGGSEGEASYWDMKYALAEQLLDNINFLPLGARVLDIGCATGSCLSAIANRGWKPYGIDINAHAISISAARVPHASLHVGTTANIPNWDMLFDAIIMSDVIEHVRNPLEELKRVYSLLRPGGYLILLTPDEHSFSSRIMRNCWIHRKPEHLFYFTREGMCSLLSESGFMSVTARQMFKPITIGYAINQFRRFHVPLFSKLFCMIFRTFPICITNHVFSFSMGEMIAFARRPL